MNDLLWKVPTPRAWPAAPCTERPKPCPFCGVEAGETQELDVGQYGVSCQCCGAIGPFPAGTTEAEAIEAWNRRAEVRP